MPTVLRSGRYRFFFFSNEGQEPPHIHVEAGDRYAKFWLDPVGLARSLGFDDSELTRLRKLILDQRPRFKEAWDGHFGR